MFEQSVGISRDSRDLPWNLMGLLLGLAA